MLPRIFFTVLLFLLIALHFSSPAAYCATPPVDLNLATKEQLMTLPGVGVEEATKIIAGRPYTSKSYLVKNKVISERLFYDIVDKTTLDLEAYSASAKEKERKAFVEESRKILASTKAVRTKSGLSYRDIVVGEGRRVTLGKKVLVQYTGWLTDGTKFDSSVDRGKPLSFTTGSHEVIPGFNEGVLSMKVGGKRRLIIPPRLAYGNKGAGDKIPSNATLIFDIELVDAQE